MREELERTRAAVAQEAEHVDHEQDADRRVVPGGWHCCVNVCVIVVAVKLFEHQQVEVAGWGST